MQKKLLFGMVILALLTVLFAACSFGEQGQTGPTTSQGNSQYPVEKLLGTQFQDSTFTIQKGDKITLVSVSQAEHNIMNGNWNGTLPKPGKEPDAPAIHVHFNGHDVKDIGPFNAVGTFHFFCTLHQGMTLVVIVK